jgi:hypothetical protein
VIGGSGASRVPDGMGDRNEAKAELLRHFGEIWFETKRKLDELGTFLQWSDFSDWREDADPDSALFEAANALLADGDSFVRKVERLRERVERPTVYFLDWSGSMSDYQVMKAFEVIKDRMRRTLLPCGAIGFDTRPSALVDMLPGTQAAQYIRNPIEVRNAANKVQGGGGTCALEAVKFCDERRMGGLVDSFKGDWRGPVRKVLFTDGYLSDEDKKLFDEIVVIPHEEPQSDGKK